MRTGRPTLLRASAISFWGLNSIIFLHLVTKGCRDLRKRHKAVRLSRVNDHGRRGSYMIRARKVFAAFALFCVFAANLPAQSLYSTLTGVVSDPSQALVAQATVRLRDEGSGSMRETTTNSQGYYTFVFGPGGHV